VLCGWFAHYAMLALYTAAHCLAAPLLRRLFPRSFTVQRWIDCWEYGAGLEHGVRKGAWATTAPGRAAAGQARGPAPGAEAAAAGASPPAAGASPPAVPAFSG